MERGPLVESLPIIKGLCCGSLLVGSFTLPYGIVSQIGLFILALLVFFDSIFIHGREMHLLSFLTMAVIGAVAGLAFAVAGLAGAYLLVIFVLLSIIYLYEFLAHRERKH